MALNYTITVHQGSDTKTRSGRVANLHELSEVIKEVNSTNKKGEQAIVNITFSEVTQSQIEYEQYLNEWVELYRRGEIPSNRIPMTEETLLETLELMKEELNPAPRKVKWTLGDRFSCPWCDNDYGLGDFCSACGKPIDWTDVD